MEVFNIHVVMYSNGKDRNSSSSLTTSRKIVKSEYYCHLPAKE